MPKYITFSCIGLWYLQVMTYSFIFYLIISIPTSYFFQIYYRCVLFCLFPPRHYGITPLWHHITMATCHGKISSWHHIIRTPWHHISIETYHHGTVSPWHHMPWHHISMSPHISFEPYHHDSMHHGTISPITLSQSHHNTIHDTISPWHCVGITPYIMTPHHKGNTCYDFLSRSLCIRHILGSVHPHLTSSGNCLLLTVY